MNLENHCSLLLSARWFFRGYVHSGEVGLAPEIVSSGALKWVEKNQFFHYKKHAHFFLDHFRRATDKKW